MSPLTRRTVSVVLGAGLLTTFLVATTKYFWPPTRALPEPEPLHDEPKAKQNRPATDKDKAFQEELKAEMIRLAADMDKDSQDEDLQDEDLQDEDLQDEVEVKPERLATATDDKILQDALLAKAESLATDKNKGLVAQALLESVCSADCVFGYFPLGESVEPVEERIRAMEYMRHNIGPQPAGILTTPRHASTALHSASIQYLVFAVEYNGVRLDIHCTESVRRLLQTLNKHLPCTRTGARTLPSHQPLSIRAADMSYIVSFPAMLGSLAPDPDLPLVADAVAQFVAYREELNREDLALWATESCTRCRDPQNFSCGWKRGPSAMANAHVAAAMVRLLAALYRVSIAICKDKTTGLLEGERDTQGYVSRTHLLTIQLTLLLGHAMRGEFAEPTTGLLHSHLYDGTSAPDVAATALLVATAYHLVALVPSVREAAPGMFYSANRLYVKVVDWALVAVSSGAIMEQLSCETCCYIAIMIGARRSAELLTKA